jgi:ABC-type lipopolysaccharide export system ATPase subunit
MSILYCDQYKIFLQLLSNQKFILFADEPLSGLDSLSSYMLVETFQRLVKNGFTIFCTLDQPSSDVYALFNKYVLGITVLSGLALSEETLFSWLATSSRPFSRLKNDFRII